MTRFWWHTPGRVLTVRAVSEREAKAALLFGIRDPEEWRYVRENTADRLWDDAVKVEGDSKCPC